MKSLTIALLFQCAHFLHGGVTTGVLNEQSLTENSQIVEKILVNFLVEHIFNDKIFISFVITKKQETPFQRDLIDAVITESAFTATTYYILNKLNDGSRHRKRTFNVILIEDSETLE